MNYIGSKHKLSAFIVETVKAVAGADLSDKIFCDLFAGTGIVGRNFKPLVRQVIANDCEFYSFILNKNYIETSSEIPAHAALIEDLNNTAKFSPRTDGFIFQNYCLGSGCGRNYFSDENGKKIDTVRTVVESWKRDGKINSAQYFFLLCSILESADKIANTASVYGAFLKRLKQSAQRDLIIEPAPVILSQNKHLVFNEDASLLIKKIAGDILYLDPPYNARQYGANYHLLNTIAEYKPFVPNGKTGLPVYTRSKFCTRNTVLKEFENIISNAQFKFIFLSYNNEGLMSVEEVKNIMQKYGKYDLRQTVYQRFKADKTERRNHKATSTNEYLHILEKR